MSSHHDISMASLEVLRAGLDALGAGDGTIIDFTTFPEAVPADPDWCVFSESFPLLLSPSFESPGIFQERVELLFPFVFS